VRRHVAIAVAAGILAVGCAKENQPGVAQQGGSPTDVAAVRSAIATANAGLIAAIEKGDAGAAAAFYDSAGMVMPHGMDASTGRAGITKMFGDMLQQLKVKDMKLEIHDVVASGDLATETGHYEWTMVPPKGAAMTEKGKYVVVWHRQPDGSWKLFRDIFNSDAPEKTAGR